MLQQVHFAKTISSKRKMLPTTVVGQTQTRAKLSNEVRSKQQRIQQFFFAIS